MPNTEASTPKLWLKLPERWRKIRDESSSRGRTFYSLIGVALLFLVWHILTMDWGGGVEADTSRRIIKPIAMPSISETLSSFHSLWFERALARSAFWSLGRVFGGFLLAASIAIPLGVISACYWRINALMRPLSVLGRNIPVAALIPLTLIWFGLGEPQKVMFIFMASGAFIYFDTVNAVNGISDTFLDTAHTLGARVTPKKGLVDALIPSLGYALIVSSAMHFITPSMGAPGLATCAIIGFLFGFCIWYPILSHQVTRKVMLPLALPDIVNSLRLLFGLAFGYIMLAEVINARHGLGAIINISQRQGPREHIYLCLVIIALLAFTIDRGIHFAQTKLFPYRKDF
ncbi:MAG: ABC-type nitrate/sulfonate/bicarbonate transport system permease component [Kiritimatiellia bacterium]|jgi:ABC-type nitrate/sulfonate/bicarbonate transport system permease component